MSVALETVLARAGLKVTAAEFLTLVEDAARRLAPPHPDPGAYFSSDQREALTEVGVDLTPRSDTDPDPRARAVATQAVLRDTALTVTEAAARLNVDASRVRHRIAAGRLMGWKDRGGWRLPAWQFADGRLLPGVEVVLPAFPPDQPPLVVAAFMTTPQEDLPLGERQATPREWLLAGGDPERVARLASVLGSPA
ncbi:helix-turn-helix domain-containing protein [Longimycelium tulufanense]|nr:helix-turn-helix domain-containing protein [Longimycelium tulufanense]